VDLKKYRSMRFQDEKPLKLEVKILHPGAAGTWIIKKETLNQAHGSVLDAWAAFDFDTELSRQDVKYLDAMSTPAFSQSTVTIGNGASLSLEVVMEPQELSLLHIFRKE